MNYDLTKVEYLHDYVLRATFKDGTSGEVDFANIVVNVVPFQILQDKATFSQAYVHNELHTLAWSSELDYDPIILYYKANKIPFPKEWGDVA